jgi:hypothetical protein
VKRYLFNMSVNGIYRADAGSSNQMRTFVTPRADTETTKKSLEADPWPPDCSFSSSLKKINNLNIDPASSPPKSDEHPLPLQSHSRNSDSAIAQSPSQFTRCPWLLLLSTLDPIHSIRTAEPSMLGNLSKRRSSYASLNFTQSQYSNSETGKASLRLRIPEKYSTSLRRLKLTLH